jgi:small subunit ribosomal protein S16
MLTIRLQRRGRKNDPSFRVLVLESKRGPKSGNYVEMVGSYDARTDRADLQADRIKHWISMGATVSGTVHNLLITKGITEGKKVNVLPKKTVAAAPVAEALAAPAEVPAAAPTEAAAPETAPIEETPAEAPVVEEAAPAAEPVPVAAPDAEEKSAE